jgi:hypothetical protein
MTTGLIHLYLVLLGKDSQACRFEGTYLALLAAYIFVKFIRVFVKFNQTTLPQYHFSIALD